MGDLRYHQVNVIPTPQTPSPWGIMTDSDDPLTGEKIAASINVWSHVTDLWSQGIVDQLRYLTGELSTEDVTDGTYVKDWALANEAASGTGILPPVTAADLQRRVLGSAGVMPSEMKDVGGAGSIMAKPEFAEALEHARQAARDIQADAFAPSNNRPTYEARRSHAAGSPLEAELTTKPMQQLAGTDKLPLNDAVMDFASPLRANNPLMAHDFHTMKENALAERGMCIMEASFPSPVSLTSLDKAIQGKFKDVVNPRTGKPYGVVRRSCGEHEAGPARSRRGDPAVPRAARELLRHRARDGSLGRLAPQLRELVGRVGLPAAVLAAPYEERQGHDGVRRSQDRGRGRGLRRTALLRSRPRRTRRISSSGCSCTSRAWSTRVRPRRTSSASSAYDFAAARMFYGQTVAVHADADMNSDKPLGKAALDKMDGFGGIVGYQYTTNGQTNIHYSQLQKSWKMLDGASCQNLSEEQVQAFKPTRLERRARRQVGPAARRPDRQGQRRVLEVQAAQGRLRALAVDARPTGTNFTTRYSSIDPQKRTRVPYGFATDRWADLGNVAVYRHDNGADLYELFNFFIAQQEVGHIFDNYRRNRQSFSVAAASSRTLERYNDEDARRRRRASACSSTSTTTSRSNRASTSPRSGPRSRSRFIRTTSSRPASRSITSRAKSLARRRARTWPSPATWSSARRTTSTRRQARRRSSCRTARAAIARTTALPALRRSASAVVGSRTASRTTRATTTTPTTRSTAARTTTRPTSAMLMTESVDNFISASRQDFLDARYRAVSLADVFPEGYRRWLVEQPHG